MAVSGNNSSSFQSIYLIRGIEVWREIRDEILKTPAHKWIRVDKSKRPYRVELPKCAQMFLSVGALNFCDEFKPFGKYNNMISTDYEEVEACSCDDEIKACIETNETTTEEVVIETGCSQTVVLSGSPGTPVDIEIVFDTPSGTVTKLMNNIPVGWSYSFGTATLTKPCYDDYVVISARYVPSNTSLTFTQERKFFVTATKTVTTKVVSSGDVYTETITPVIRLDEEGVVILDGDRNPIIDMVTTKSLVCKLDVKPCGCIEVSQKNLGVISSCDLCEVVKVACGEICQNYFEQPNEDSLVSNSAGYYKHEDGSRMIYLYGDIPSQVLVNFKTNGEVEENMPIFCLSTFFSGMESMNAMYSKTMNRFEKAQAKQNHWQEKRKLELSLPRNMLSASQWDKAKIGYFVKW